MIFIVSGQSVVSDYVFANLFAKQTYIPKFDYIFSSLPDRLLAVQENLGYTVVQKKIFSNYNLGKIRLVDFDPPYELELVMAYLKDRSLSPLEKKFLNGPINCFKTFSDGLWGDIQK